MTTKQEAAERELLTRGYLHRRADTLEEVIETAPVFGKKYDKAVTELEEVHELLGIEQR